jgi:hypothetical protein
VRHEAGGRERPTRIQDWSAIDWRWAVRLANQGYGAEDIARILRKKPARSKAPYSMKYMRLLEEKGPERANAYARRTAEKAVDWARKNPAIRDRGAAVEELVRIQEAADSIDWLQHGGPDLRRALEGLFMVGEQLGGISFGLALRDWAERVGMEMQYVRYRRDKLIELAWLRRTAPDGTSRSDRFRLRAPRLHSLTCPVPQSLHTGGETVHGAAPSAGSPDPLDHPDRQGRFLDRANRRCAISHDAFRPLALGDLAWYALSLLPQALEEVVAGDLLDRLAIEYGTFGAAEADRATHRAERDAYSGTTRVAAHA